MTKKTYKPLVLLYILLLTTTAQAQSITSQSVNSGGTKMSQSNGSLSFSVGELVVLTQKDSQGNTLGNGFTSGATITTASILEPNAEILNVKVYPNPTTDLVTITIMDTKLSEIILEIKDINGKAVSTEKYAGVSNNIGINTATWNIGNYFLYLKNNENQVVGTYKIIKE
jgi:hypothetical protein